jgi:hypothetical protein
MSLNSIKKEKREEILEQYCNSIKEKVRSMDERLAKSYEELKVIFADTYKLTDDTKEDIITKRVEVILPLLAEHTEDSNIGRTSSIIHLFIWALCMMTLHLENDQREEFIDKVPDLMRGQWTDIMSKMKEKLDNGENNDI